MKLWINFQLIAHFLGEPNNAGGDEDCVMLSTSYGWNDVSCEADHAQVVIEYGPTPSTVCLHGDL